MPLTFVSHQAPVLPLKLVAPKWFDGTALALGSMAPDLAFALNGTPARLNGHQLWALLWFCLPVTLVLTWLMKRVIAGTLAPHLPRLGAFHLDDYGRLASWRLPADVRGWAVLLWSAFLGALSHVGIDSFTHGDRWVTRRVGVLDTYLFELPVHLTGKAVYVHDLLQLAGTVIGAAVTVWCLYYVGRHRLLRDWYPSYAPLTATSASIRRLCGFTAGGAAAGVVVAAAMWNVGRAQHAVMRGAALTFAGLLVGCLTARGFMKEGPPPEDLGDGGVPASALTASESRFRGPGGGPSSR